jgi:hypothetical protein
MVDALGVDEGMCIDWDSSVALRKKGGAEAPP